MTPEKTPIESVSVSLRISLHDHGRLKEIAKRKHLPVGTILRVWILERLEEEDISYLNKVDAKTGHTSMID